MRIQDAKRGRRHISLLLHFSDESTGEMDDRHVQTKREGWSREGEKNKEKGPLTRMLQNKYVSIEVKGWPEKSVFWRFA